MTRTNLAVNARVFISLGLGGVLSMNGREGQTACFIRGSATAKARNNTRRNLIRSRIAAAGPGERSLRRERWVLVQNDVSLLWQRWGVQGGSEPFG